MKRLVDRNGSASGAEAELIDLIEACEPVNVSELGKKRSLGAVYQRHHQRRRTTRFALRLAMASGVLLVAGAATAAFGVRWRARPEPPAAVAVTPAPHHPARPLHARVAEASPAPELATAPATAPAAAPVPSAPASSGHHTRVVRSEDPSLVVSAIQALRQDHDPARASHLLAAYLRTYPRGALVEEAIALSFEAADARRSPAAATFAERYLRDYPQGRFHAAAERVLARPTP